MLRVVICEILRGKESYHQLVICITFQKEQRETPVSYPAVFKGTYKKTREDFGWWANIQFTFLRNGIVMRTRAEIIGVMNFARLTNET